MASYTWLAWLGLMLLFALAEAATVGLVSIWFVGGSLAGLVVNLLGGSAAVQLLAFALGSAVLLICLRPFVRRYITPRKTATNANAALGRTALLTQTVDNLQGTGALKLDGKEWTVRSTDGSVLPAGTLVKIVRLEGVKLLVEPAAPVP